MLVEFANLETNNARGFQRATQLIAHLMRHQFVHIEDRGGAVLLETFHRPEIARLVTAYFDVAGYHLVHREAEGWAGILPDPERVTPPRVRINETLMLLVLRRLWEEALELGEIQAKGTVRTTVNEAYAAYQEIVAGTRRATLTAPEFRDLLQLLERRALVRLGEMEPEAQDMDLDIRALITTVAGDDFLGSLEQLLQRGAQLMAEEEATPSGEDAA